MIKVEDDYRYLDVLILEILRTSLENQNSLSRILRQSVRKNATSRPSTDYDVVVGLPHWYWWAFYLSAIKSSNGHQMLVFR